MTSSAFISGMKQFGVSASYPPTDDQKNQLVDIISKLYQNKTQGAAVLIDELARQCIPETELENTAICLACTELPLAFQDFSNDSSFGLNGLTYINSSVVHAKSIFNECIHEID